MYCWTSITKKHTHTHKKDKQIPSNTIKYHCFIKLLCNLPKFVSRLAWLKKIQTTSWPPAPPTTNLHVVVDQLLGSQKSSEKKKKLTKLVFVGSTKEVLACFLCIFPRFWKKIMENQNQRHAGGYRCPVAEAWGPEPRVWEYCSRSDSWKSAKVVWAQLATPIIHHCVQSYMYLLKYILL